MKHIFIIGSKGIPANYGGFETFVDQLTANRKTDEIKYHISCLADNKDEFEYNQAHCFNIKVPSIGAASAVYYDMAAFAYCNRYIKEHNIKNAIVYVLACRIGPFIGHYSKKLKKLGGAYYVNPDGHEWKRSKWNTVIRKYWKVSEKLMIKNAGLVICDSVNIEKYIKKEYSKYVPKTTYIAYGADVKKSSLHDDDKNLVKWYYDKKVNPNEYYLMVGRFVPENNYEVIISEFIKSKSKMSLVIITNTDNLKLLEGIRQRTNFNKDERVKFVGTVYDQELLKKIRENAYGYIHGHSVGGTNPSLLEALSATKLNLLLDVGFNKEVASDGAFYWGKSKGSLSKLIDKMDKLEKEEIEKMSERAKEQIINRYCWEFIVKEYEKVLGEI